MKRDQIIRLVLTEGEKAAIVAAAKAAGVPAATWARMVALEKAGGVANDS